MIYEKFSDILFSFVLMCQLIIQFYGALILKSHYKQLISHFFQRCMHTHSIFIGHQFFMNNWLEISFFFFFFHRKFIYDFFVLFPSEKSVLRFIKNWGKQQATFRIYREREKKIHEQQHQQHIITYCILLF